MSAHPISARLAALLVLAAGLLAGLGVGAASPGHAAGTRGTTATTAQTPTTVATVPEPVVTAVQPPTVPASSLPGTGRPTVLLGDMNTPEQFVIGQLYQLALARLGYTVQLSRNDTVVGQRLAGLRSGTLDIYPEYLGEWNSQVAHLHRRFQTLRAAFAAGSAYARRHGFVLLPPTPFSDTKCVAVLTQYARANHVHSLTQLGRGGPIIFGAPIEFQSAPDGLPALRRVYHLTPDYVQPIAVGFQYWWLRTSNVQAAYCATTDPQLSGPAYVALQDPRRVFGHGNVVPVTTPHVLRVEGRPFRQAIERVDALLTLRAMRGLDAEIELGGHSPTAIAQQFLEGNGILPPSRYAPVPPTPTTSSSTTTAR